MNREIILITILVLAFSLIFLARPIIVAQSKEYNDELNKICQENINMDFLCSPIKLENKIEVGNE